MFHLNIDVGWENTKYKFLVLLSSQNSGAQQPHFLAEGYVSRVDSTQAHHTGK